MDWLYLSSEPLGRSHLVELKVSLDLHIVSLVAAELGVALVPASLQNLQRAGVVYKPLEDQTLYVKLAVVWRSANTSPVLHQFLAQSRAVTRFSAAFH
ncbi:MAG: LysR substrate-binding domain-containing protein [Nostoc sp.]